MGGCTACTKFVLATVNIITIMLGIVLAATGIVVIVKGHVYFPEVPKYSSSFHTPCSVLIVLGFLMIMFGVYGAYSTFSGRSGFLNCFFFLILTFALLEIAALVALIIKRPFVSDYVMTNVEDWFNNVNHDNATELQMVAVSTIQLSLECCGMTKVDPSLCVRGTCYVNDNITDTRTEVDGTQYWTMWNNNNMVPASCCRSRAKPTSAAYYCNRFEDPNIQSSPCYPRLAVWLEYAIWGLVGAFGGLIVLNLCLMFSAKWLRNKERDDEYLYTRYNNHDTSSSFTEKTRDTADTGFNSTWL